VNRLIIRPGHDRRIRSGHPWIFSNEIARIEGDSTPGDALHVCTHRGETVGVAYYNPHSLIAARLLTNRVESIDTADFYRKRIDTAIAHRREIYGELDALRIIYGEGDGLPGLVVDRYGDVLSVQFLTLGIDKRREIILQALLETFNPVAVVARNDVAVRELEGLPLTTELLYGDLPSELIVHEHGLKFRVDVMGGQKTGHFLDQKENHLALKGRVEGRRVLDLFCYSGSWGIHAAHFGASHVLGVDISRSAVELSSENARINTLDALCSFHKADVFDLLKEKARSSERFGTVILDPPAFVKSRKKLPEAIKGYLTVNRRAMELVETGGYLFTCSCSYHMDRETFLETLRMAAVQTKRTVRLVEMRGQSFDHPVLLSCPETEYLKCAILQIL